MKKVELIKGISSSALGFGCAPILGAVDAKTAKRALDCAIDCGIIHFDLARSYGYGEAEKFVGQVLKGKRDKVVIASKFGIQANWKAQLLKPAKPLLRFALNTWKDISAREAKPGEKTGGNTRKVVADNFHKRVPFRGNEMRKNLEQSLRSLGTDYLDYFFIHEPLTPLLYLEELIDTSEKLKAEGKIRALGIAYMREQQSMHSSYLNKFDVQQFDISPGAPGYKETLAERRLQPNVIFSPLRGGSKELKPSEKLKKLFEEFPNSVVLCSMFNEQHIRANTALLVKE